MVVGPRPGGDCLRSGGDRVRRLDRTGWDGPKVVVTVGEKGVAWRRLRVRGTPGHGSTPYGKDNAVVKAAEVIRRLGAYEPKAKIPESWRHYLERSRSVGGGAGRVA